MRKINEIIVHCAATRPDWWASRSLSQKVTEVRKWHVQDRGWRDIGYHFLIDRDGKVAEGRPVDQAGAHTKGKNTGTIGVCLFGGHGASATDSFEDHFTKEQDVALRALLARLRNQYGRVPVAGHNQYANKGCPGFNAPDWFAREAPKSATKPSSLAAIIAAILSMFGAKK